MTYAWIRISLEASKEYPLETHESELFNATGLVAEDVERIVRQLVQDKYPQFEVSVVDVE